MNGNKDYVCFGLEIHLPHAWHRARFPPEFHPASQCPREDGPCVPLTAGRVRFKMSLEKFDAPRIWPLRRRRLSRARHPATSCGAHVGTMAHLCGRRGRAPRCGQSLLCWNKPPACQGRRGQGTPGGGLALAPPPRQRTRRRGLGHESESHRAGCWQGGPCGNQPRAPSRCTTISSQCLPRCTHRFPRAADARGCWSSECWGGPATSCGKAWPLICTSGHLVPPSQRRGSPPCVTCAALSVPIYAMRARVQHTRAPVSEPSGACVLMCPAIALVHLRLQTLPCHLQKVDGATLTGSSWSCRSTDCALVCSRVLELRSKFLKLFDTRSS